MFAVKRPINGISINGDEWLLDDQDENPRLFPDIKSARDVVGDSADVVELCHVSWRMLGTLTEDPPQCYEIMTHRVYLNCDHERTISYKENAPGYVCEWHANMVKNEKGICGCSWIVEKL